MNRGRWAEAVVVLVGLVVGGFLTLGLWRLVGMHDLSVPTPALGLPLLLAALGLVLGSLWMGKRWKARNEPTREELAAAAKDFERALDDLAMALKKRQGKAWSLLEKGYPLTSGLTDDWALLLDALLSIEAQAASELAEQERRTTGALIRAISARVSRGENPVKVWLLETRP